MAPLTVPEPVLRFVQTNISSVLQLEILLLLVARRQAWSASAVAAELRLTRHLAEIRLRELHLRRFLRHSIASGTYVYAPRSAEQESIIADLAACYPVLRHRFIATIYSMQGGAPQRAGTGPSKRGGN